MAAYEEVDDQLIDLSNFGGYDGTHDDLINNFSGAPGEGDFRTQLAFTRNYVFEVDNQSSQPQKIILNNFFGNPTPGRVLREGPIPYAVGATNLICTSEKGDMNTMIDWITRNPTMVTGQQLETTDMRQWDQKYYQRTNINPFFEVAPNEMIILTRYKDTYAQNAKIIRVPTQFILDYETETFLTIPAATKTIFTWEVGVHASLVKQFRAKAIKAQGNPAVRSAQALSGVTSVAIGGAPRQKAFVLGSGGMGGGGIV